VSVPASLRSPELGRLWEGIRERLEARGEGARGRLRLPRLPAAARLVLKSLLDRLPDKTIDLKALEAALVRLGIADDLAGALAALGYPVSGEQARRRAQRAARREALQAARAQAAGWPEPWAGRWIDEVIRAGMLRGMDIEGARSLLQRARAVLDHLEKDHPAPLSRVELAARVLGSSHALDTGTRLEAAVARALAYNAGPADHRDLWAQAGVHLDLTSGPVLTWGLPFTGGLARVAAAALEAGIPLHLSRFALESHPAAVPTDSSILVAENPRVVEAAAQLRAPVSVISTNGNPGSAVLLLLTQLRTAGAALRYHGDFDTAGLAICARLMRLGLTPWRMDAQDYRAALAAADAAGAALPTEPHAPGPTPWDSTLREVFDQERRVVHEERLLPGLLG
jgi:uncharacterized protein (TIGR02679 family)